MRRVVITGMGAVTPVGNNVNDMWEAVKAGKCGIGKITHFNTENSAVRWMISRYMHLQLQMKQ